MRRGKTILARGLSKASITASRHAKATVAILLVVTIVLGFGITKVQFSSNLIDVLPEGNPNTAAAKNVSEEFPGHHSYVTFLFGADPEKWEQANEALPYRVPPDMQAPPNGTVGPQYEDEDHPGYDEANPGAPGWNITDEVYVRGIEEFQHFLRQQARDAGIEAEIFAIAYNTHVKLVNWTNEIAANCPQSTSPDLPLIEPPEETECDRSAYEDAFSVPGTSPDGEDQYALDWGTVWTSAPKEVQTQASPSWLVSRPVFVFQKPGGENATHEDYNRWGSFFFDASQEYREMCRDGELTWDVWKCDLLAVNDAKIVADAHQADVTREDIQKWGPAVLAFIFVSLYLAFRSGRAVGVGFGALGLVATWSYGLLGWVGIPLNELNLAVVPLILGNGIDFSLHYINEYLEHTSEGASTERAWELAGQRAGSAVFIATATTVSGLLMMGLSPSPLIAELGLLAAFAMAAMLVIILTFIPAGLALVGDPGKDTEFRPSRLMPKLAGTVSKYRTVALAVVLVASGALAYSAQDLEYATFGDPSKNFPEGDPIREQEDIANRAFFGREVADFESNWIILEGDLTDPAAHDYIRDLQNDMARSEQIRTDSVTSIVNLVTQWVSIKDGTPGAIPRVAQEEAEPGSTYPTTREGIKENLDEMYNSPFETYPALFMSQEYDTTVILIDIYAGTTFEDAEAAWDHVWGIIEENEENQPNDVQVSLGGYTSYSYLFIEHEMPWLTYMSLAAAAAVLLLVGALTRDPKATLIVGTVVGVTSLWWLGVLPLMDIPLAITLTLPAVFIMALGSDYAVHLIWNFDEVGDRERVWATTGKAIMFSALTDAGAFALFIPMRNLMMRNAMIATTIAIALIFLATVLIIPAFYRFEPAQAPESESHDAGRPKPEAQPVG